LRHTSHKDFVTNYAAQGSLSILRLSNKNIKLNVQVALFVTKRKLLKKDVFPDCEKLKNMQ
jgi:hypothetical protein